MTDRIDYRGHLIQVNGIPEMGELKWETVQSFIAFSQHAKDTKGLLQFIYRIAQGYKSFEKEPEENWLKVMTVYRAKGLEWDIVFIPGCNQGVFPYLRDGEGDLSSLEAERRLFFVGLTRAKQNLYLSHLETDPISQFLLEANSKKVTEDAYELKEILKNPIPKIMSSDLLRKLEEVACQYPLGSTFGNGSREACSCSYPSQEALLKTINAAIVSPIHEMVSNQATVPLLIASPALLHCLIITDLYPKG